MHLALEFSADSGKVSVQFLDLLPGWASSAVLLISQPDVEKPVLLNPCEVTMLVPNTFMGGFSAFASGGDWKMLCICLVLGNILGVCCDYSGRFLAAKFGKDN